MRRAFGVLIPLVLAGCGGAGQNLNQTSITCPAGRTLLDGVCVKEAVADYVACVRAQGAQLGAGRAQKIAADASYAGAHAGGAAEVSETLEKKYTASDAAILEIIRACDAASGVTRAPSAPPTPQKEASPADAAALATGVYQIRAMHSALCLDIEGVSNAAGAKLWQWDCYGGKNQQFKATRQPDGTYTLVAQHSGSCIDVSGVSKDNGAQVWQWSCHFGPNQRYLIEPQSNGFRIVSVNSGKCFDISAVSKDKGASVIQWDCHGGANQTFAFTRVD